MEGGFRLPALVRSAVNLALPPRCPTCGEMVADDLQFCAPCWARLEFLAGPGCAACGRPLADGRVSATLCGPCIAHPPQHDGLAAAVVYDEHSRAVPLALKYRGRIGNARLMGSMLARHMPHDAADWLLVPVPLHRWRLWRRGFNQAVLISRDLAKRFHACVLPDALIRTRNTPPLKGMNARERQRLVRGAIALNAARKKDIQSRKILLVDDVYTSGATTDACVRALKKAGAAHVRVLCWARVLREGEEGAG